MKRRMTKKITPYRSNKMGTLYTQQLISQELEILYNYYIELFHSVKNYLEINTELFKSIYNL